jgi:hypothetical protein
VLDPPPPLHPANHDHVPAPRLAKEDELDGLLLATGRALVSGLTLPFRLVGNVLSLVLPFRARAKLHSHGHGAANGFPQSGAEREPFRGEAAEELHDALSPAYDQLRIARPWWILEYIPLRMRRGMAVFDTSNVGADYHWLYVYRLHGRVARLTRAASTAAKDARCSRRSSRRGSRYTALCGYACRRRPSTAWNMCRTSDRTFTRTRLAQTRTR